MTQDEIIELAKQAGFEDFNRWCEHYPQETQRWCQRMEAFAKLVAAKALAQTQEPVAWEQLHEHMAGSFYKAPPQRTWVGLDHQDKKKFSSWLDSKTDDEVFTAIDNLLEKLNT
jgi:hypothetical protein